MKELTAISRIQVIGFGARTANRNETGADGRIGPLWNAFLQGGAERIPGVADAASIYSIYTNYESDHNGEYDIIIGRETGADMDAPEGLKRIEIPGGRYVTFEAAGPSPVEIWEAWSRVYAHFSDESEPLKRAFTVDFEKHTPHGITLFIAVGE